MKPDPAVGLCAHCAHAHCISHPRGGNDYWMCRKAEDDPALAKYPRLPVLSCTAYAPARDSGDGR